MATNITEDMEDYKEKYENAVNELRNLLSMLMEQNVINADGIINTNLERIFPELRESEDEKIRKELIQFVKDYPNLPNGKYCRTDFFNWLEKQGEQPDANKEYWRGYREGKQKILEKYATLEKQGEQKPADKFEPKFNVGDWLVCCNYEPEQIIGIRNDMYEMSNGDIRPIKMINKNHNIRLWAIQDAKDGDVLSIHSSESDSDCIFLYQNTVEIEPGRNVAVAYCGIDVYADRIEFGIQGPDCIDVRKIKPATKKQRDLLFTKMKEVGYEWDAEKKELKKINLIKAEHGKYYYCIKDYFSGGKKFSSKGDIVQALRGWPIMGLEDISEYFLPVDKIQKSTWSEEDERIRGAICDTLDRIDEHIMKCHQRLTHQQVKDWLKSLKERIQPQTEQELSEDAATHEYIDLGLPSGTLWKLFNEDGHYRFDEAVEKFGDLLPTKEQWEELKDECKWVWKDNGYDVIGPNGNSIFLPADGFRHGTEVNYVDRCGFYWSSIYHDEYTARLARNIYFNCGHIYMSHHLRNNELAVRLVK